MFGIDANQFNRFFYILHEYNINKIIKQNILRFYLNFKDKQNWNFHLNCAFKQSIIGRWFIFNLNIKDISKSDQIIANSVRLPENESEYLLTIHDYLINLNSFNDKLNFSSISFNDESHDIEEQIIDESLIINDTIINETITTNENDNLCDIFDKLKLNEIKVKTCTTSSSKLFFKKKRI
jgi:hypothetical protein